MASVRTQTKFYKSALNKGFSKGGRGKPRHSFKKSVIKNMFVKLFGSPYQDVPLGNLPPLPFIKDEGKRRLVRKWYGIFRTKPFKRFIGKIPFFAFMVYGVSKTTSINCLQEHIKWYEDLVRDKGPVFTVKLLKRVRDACLRFAADQSFERIDELSLHKDGLPLKVGHLMPFLTSKDVRQRRFAIQVLDIIKLCEVPGDDPSTESITTPIPESSEIKGQFIGETMSILGKPRLNPLKLNKLISSFRNVLQRMFPKQKVQERLKDLASLSDIHMSVRKGPNGPALGSIIEDFYGITQSGLIEPITEIAEITENHQLLICLRELEIEKFSGLHNNLAEEPCLDSRLAIKHEPWGKTRFFAICDWFSQSALKGLHKWIFNWLSKQAEDGTMSQDRVAEIVRAWTAIGDSRCSVIDEIYSLDLSKATDRLPATLQREIIQQMFGKFFADRWYTICTRRNFQTPGGGTVRFAAGQPLGVYSSWAMLALTHHTVCRTALELLGQRWGGENPHYVVIGDDVAMKGAEIAEQYTLIMHTVLRVEISKIKGFTPDTSIGLNPLLRTVRSNSAELAKRVFTDGYEITTVSPETLKSASEYPADFPNLLRQLHNRGCLDDLIEPVAPIALACLGFKPDIACTFATFPLRPAIPFEMVKAVLVNSPDVLSFIPWFQTSIPISESELDSMFRWSVRESLQSTLDKFEDNFNKFIELSRRPNQRGERVYHSKVKEYIIRVLLNRAMLYILDLVVESNLLNFQGPGQKLDEIASALNTMLDFELALKGQPSNKRENLHRLRSRVITQLQPRVLRAIQKAKEYFGILLIDAGEHKDFVSTEWVNISDHIHETRELLSSDSDKLLYDLEHERFLDVVRRRTKEVVA